MSNEVLTTRRAKIRYGDRCVIAGKPALQVKFGSKRDFVTREEILEDLYGRPLGRVKEEGNRTVIIWKGAAA